MHAAESKNSGEIGKGSGGFQKPAATPPAILAFLLPLLDERAAGGTGKARGIKIRLYSPLWRSSSRGMSSGMTTLIAMVTQEVVC